MDIKERKAFEEALSAQTGLPIENLHICTVFDANKNIYTPSDVCDPKDDVGVHRINIYWNIWQAAKAQAVPEPTLDAPARVGGGIFQKGIKWSTVIGAAQRHYEHGLKEPTKPIICPADMLRIAAGELVLVPTKNTKYFSHDGENYEVHDTLAEAKHEAECAIESFRERLANQLCNPPEDGNFQQVGYGIVLAESGYSVDHIVTQEDVDNGEYGYDVGTEIMSLFLIEAQEAT